MRRTHDIYICIYSMECGDTVPSLITANESSSDVT